MQTIRIKLIVKVVCFAQRVPVVVSWVAHVAASPVSSSGHVARPLPRQVVRTVAKVASRPAGHLSVARVNALRVVAAQVAGLTLWPSPPSKGFQGSDLPKLLGLIFLPCASYTDPPGVIFLPWASVSVPSGLIFRPWSS